MWMVEHIGTWLKSHQKSPLVCLSQTHQNTTSNLHSIYLYGAFSKHIRPMCAIKCNVSWVSTPCTTTYTAITLCRKPANILTTYNLSSIHTHSHTHGPSIFARSHKYKLQNMFWILIIRYFIVKNLYFIPTHLHNYHRKWTVCIWYYYVVFSGWIRGLNGIREN